MIFLNWLKRKDPKPEPEQVRFDRLAKRLESSIEQRFWVHAYGHLSALGRFTPQVSVEGYRPDFILTHIPGVDLLKVVIELDGHDYHSTPKQRDCDTARDRALMKSGWQVVRFTGKQINRDCAGCVRETVGLVREWTRWLR